jgi:hypothetical protein
MTRRWRDEHILGDLSGGASSLLIATLAASWRGAPCVRSSLSPAADQGPPMGRCDWCGGRHPRNDASDILLICQGTPALYLRGDLLHKVRRLYELFGYNGPLLLGSSAPPYAILYTLFGPTAKLTAALTTSFIDTVGAREMDSQDDIEELPPMSSRARRLARGDDEDYLDDEDTSDSSVDSDDDSADASQDEDAPVDDNHDVTGSTI